jgi:hypothetical protein
MGIASARFCRPGRTSVEDIGADVGTAGGAATATGFGASTGFAFTCGFAATARGLAFFGAAARFALGWARLAAGFDADFAIPLAAGLFGLTAGRFGVALVLGFFFFAAISDILNTIRSVLAHQDALDDYPGVNFS